MSFFEDLLGGAALSGEKVLGDRIEQQQALARQDHESQLATDRARTAEALKLDLQEKQRTALQQRTAQQAKQVEAAAPEITRARELTSAQQVAPSVTGDVMANIKSKLSPSQVAKYYGVDNSPVAAIDDRLGYARDQGLYEAEAQLSAQRNETVKTMQAQQQQRYQDGQLANAEERNRIAEKKGENQFTAQMARTDAYEKRQSGSDRQTQVEKLTTEKARALQELGILMEKGNAKVDGPRISQIKANLVELDDMLRARRAPGEAASPAPAAPKAAPAIPATWKQIGTSGGKPVYQDPVSGKKYQ